MNKLKEYWKDFCFENNIASSDPVYAWMIEKFFEWYEYMSEDDRK